MRLCLPLPSQSNHFDENFSRLHWSSNFPQECDPGPTHTILGFQAKMEAQTIDRSHLGILGFNVSKPLREQDERILMVGVHVLHDVDLVVNQRIWPGLGILRGCYPSHYSKASDKVDVHDIHSEKEEIVKIDPVFAVCVTR